MGRPKISISSWWNTQKQKGAIFLQLQNTELYHKHTVSSTCWLIGCMRITGDVFNFYNQLMCNQLPQLYTIIFPSDNVNAHKGMALMILSTPYNNGRHNIKSCPLNPCGSLYDFHIKEIKYIDYANATGFLQSLTTELYHKHVVSCACWLIACMRVKGDGFNCCNQFMCNQLPHLYMIQFCTRQC